MRLENIDEFARRVNRKRRTIFDFYRKNPELKLETKKKGIRRYIPVEHEKYWKSELLFNDNKKLNEDIRMTKNLVDYLHSNKCPYGNYFWGLEWTHFIGINYKEERSKDYCVTIMKKCFELLNKEFGHRTTLRLLFSTEAFSGLMFFCYNIV